MGHYQRKLITPPDKHLITTKATNKVLTTQLCSAGNPKYHFLALLFALISDAITFGLKTQDLLIYEQGDK